VLQLEGDIKFMVQDYRDNQVRAAENGVKIDEVYASYRDYTQQQDKIKQQVELFMKALQEMDRLGHLVDEANRLWVFY